MGKKIKSVVVKPKRKEIEIEKKENSSFVLPENLTGIITQELWTDWVEYRKEIKKPLTETSIKKQVDFLIVQPNPAECINSAIRNRWQGLFEISGTIQKPKITGNQKQAVEFPGGVY